MSTMLQSVLEAPLRGWDVYTGKNWVIVQDWPEYENHPDFVEYWGSDDDGHWFLVDVWNPWNYDDDANDDDTDGTDDTDNTDDTLSPPRGHRNVTGDRYSFKPGRRHSRRNQGRKPHRVSRVTIRRM